MTSEKLAITFEPGGLPGLWHWSLMLEAGKYIQTVHGWKFGHKRAEVAMTQALEEMRLFAEETEK